MPKHAKKTKRTRHGARKWLLKALEPTLDGAAMRTSELMRRASQLSGSDLPGYSVYQALRTLVKNKAVAARREGRELTYRLTGQHGRRPSAPAPPSVPATPTAPVQPASTPPVAATPAPSPAPKPALSPTPIHTLAPGEVAILHVGESHVESATNVHGQLVLAKHKRPK